MTGPGFDVTPLLAPNTPPASGRWQGFAEHYFVGGNNAPEGVPISALADAAKRVLTREGHKLATYNLADSPLGYLPLREFVAGQLESVCGITDSADDILITSGSLQGLDLVNEVLLAPGDTVITEQFSYGGALSRLAKRGVKVIGIPLDDQGMRTDLLATTLADLKQRGVTPKFIYVIPTVQNPTGAVMGLERRHELLALAKRYGVMIFEDECYADLIWGAQRPPALRALDHDGHVVYVGSFSKSIAPALRVGYLVADWQLMSRILACKSDAGSGALEQLMLAEFCAGHFAQHVESLNEILRSKANNLIAALDKNFGTSAEYQVPVGGIFLWVTFPAAIDTLALANAAAAAGIIYNPGPEWSTDSAPAQHSLRLCFASPSEQNMQAGVAALAEVFSQATGIPGQIANVPKP